MFNFNFGNKKIIGIDVGTSSLKMVELEMRDGRPFLSNYAWMPTPGETDKTAGYFEAVVPEYLKKMIKEAEFEAKSAYIAIPSLGGLVMLVDFPELPEEDMEEAIRFEVQKYIPTSLDEVSLSWEVVSGTSESNKVLFVASSKKKVAAYGKMVKQTGLALKGAQMENLSIIDSLVGNDKGNFLLADIGFHVCNIVCVIGGVAVANRNVDVGGADINQTVANSLGISSGAAETMKLSGKNFFSREYGLRFPPLDIAVEEMERVLESLKKEGGQAGRPETLILSGGSSGMAGLKEFFQQKTGLKTIIGDPFGRIGWDKKIAPALEKMKGMFSVSVGLALEGLNASQKRKEG